MANKGKPFSVRVDLEKFDFVKKREKLETGQQVIDFFLNKYWWDWKLPIPTHKEAPPLDLKNLTTNEPAKKEMPVKQPKTMLKYFEDKRECTCQEDYQAWLSEVESDPFLSYKQKELLKTTNQ